MAQATVFGPILKPLGLGFISPEAVRSGYVSFRYASGKAESELGVRFRPAEQAWRETLLAEEALRVDERARSPGSSSAGIHEKP
jgi:hypothetical protein